MPELRLQKTREAYQLSDGWATLSSVDITGAILVIDGVPHVIGPSVYPPDEPDKPTTDTRVLSNAQS